VSEGVPALRHSQIHSTQNRPMQQGECRTRLSRRQGRWQCKPGDQCRVAGAISGAQRRTISDTHVRFFVAWRFAGSGCRSARIGKHDRRESVYGIWLPAVFANQW